MTKAEKIKANEEATRKIVAVFEGYEAEDKAYWEEDWEAGPITLSPRVLSAKSGLSVQKVVALAKSNTDLFRYEPGYRVYDDGTLASESGYYEAEVTWSR